MNFKNIIIMLVCLMSIKNLAQENNIVQDSILVRGNCVMCKNNIENAIKKEISAKGEWDIKTKVLKFSYDKNKTSKSKIMRRIADKGYDNQMFTAEDKDYQLLPDCCKYDRVTAWENIENSKGTHLPNEEEHQNDEHDEDENLMEDDIISLNEIKAEGNKAATILSKKETGLTFKIDQSELKKAACCNLSESFETNATVDVAYANAVTGTKQIKMLGLDQKYMLITKELLPEIRGLSVAYGMNFIPGRWIKGIQLTKGGSTVTNGYESISGQINTELFKGKKDKTSINLFANTGSRIEGNLVHVDAINDKWNHSTLLHGNSNLERLDLNNDGFIDTPVGRQLNMTYLINYYDLDNSGWGTHFGINFLDDHRTAGQMGFIENKHINNNQFYGVGINSSRFQVWNKTGHVFKDKPYQSIGLMTQLTNYEQDSYFGLTKYNGKQNTIYSNLIFESIFGNTFHKYKTGVSYLHDVFDENYLSQNFKRNETVPGAFFEYTYSGDRLTLVSGARVDFHNLAGTQFTPRLNIKYDLFPETIIRASAGKGFRTANVFAESQAYMASNRNIEIVDSGGDIYGLKPEIAWNYGLSVQQEFNIFGRKSTIIADYFKTFFQNQIIPDLEHSTHKILFYNIKDNSFANSFQIQWDFKLTKRLDFRLAYKNYQTEVSYNSGKKELPFTAKNRGFLNIAYSTYKTANNKQWSFDTTLQYIGKQRIPNTKSNPIEFQLADYSDAYFLWNAQISHQFNRVIGFYVGAENILSYTQENPILDAKNPFGNYFDGGMIYAPISPISFHLGIDIDF